MSSLLPERKRPACTRILVLAVLFFLPTTAAVRGQVPEIRGTVRSTVDNLPVASALVRVAGAAGGEVTTLTDAQGAFRLAPPSAGPAVIEVTHPAFSTYHSERSLDAGDAVLVLYIRLSPVEMDAIVVSASRAPESRLSAPSTMTTLDQREIEARPAVTPVEHLRGVAGVDMITTGLQSANVTTRGFNNIFSGALHMLTDYRIAGVPSLRVNLLHFVPSPTVDTERMEVVLGPGSALYGPNTANGVLHTITRSPLDDPGTTLTLAGGERSLLQTEFRTAHRLSDRFGIKVSGQYVRADEWESVDSVEALGRRRALEAGDATTRIGQRDFGIERWSVDGRADLRVGEDARTVLSVGRMQSVSGIELTSVGAAQAVDWSYSYAQLRLHAGRFFAQTYINASDAGDTYLLREGTPLVDDSRLYVAQVQHGVTLAGVDFTGGADYLRTEPRTGGTINGVNEDDDIIDEVGGFLGARVPVGSRLDLLAVGRLDWHSELPDPVFSPRVGLVYRPAPQHALRVTWNRAFSTPTTPNLFLDIPAGPAPDDALAALGYRVRAQAPGRDGFHFRVNGPSDLSIRSPFNPGGAGQVLNGSSATLLHLAAGVLEAQGAIDAATAALLRSLQPSDAQVGVLLLDLANPSAAPVPQQNVDLEDAPGIRETINNTVEAGYTGQIGQHFAVSAGAWYSRITNFVTALNMEAGYLSFLDGPALGGYLTEQLIAAGVPPAAAQEQAAALAGAMAQIPLGVVTSPDMKAQGAEILATFRNFGEVELYGADLAVDATFGVWGARLALSAVSDDHFFTDGRYLMLNAPARKASASVRYAPTGLWIEGRVRHMAGFPANSAVYRGMSCVTGMPLDGDCVDATTQLDLNGSWDIPGMTGVQLQAAIQNVFDDRHVSFPGAPEVGRLALLRMVYSF